MSERTRAHVARSSTMCDALPRVGATAALLLSLAIPHLAWAQAAIGHIEDATVVPRGLVRFRSGVVWTRYDSRFTGFGVEPLGNSLTSDSLGPARFIPLAPIEALVGSASGLPFALSLGRSRLGALGREEILPFSLEYGITDRVTIGVMVPVVRKRASVQFLLDSAGANVGPNLHRTSGAAQATNITVQNQFTSAAQQLRDALDACLAAPGGPGCPALLARQAEAEALLDASTSFAATAAALYGSADSQGSAFVPLSTAQAQQSVAARVAEFNNQYRDILASGTDLLTAVPVGAGGPAGTSEFQRYLFSELGRDSLVTQERVGFGDVEISAKALLIDRPGTADRRLGTYVAAQAGVRLPSGSRQSPSDLVDLRLGGTFGIDLRGFADLQFGRAGLLATTAFHTRDVEDDDNRDSRVYALHLAPRWHLSAPLAIHGSFTHRHGDVSATMRLVGGGVSFTNMNATRARDGRLPIEMRFTHLEAISGAVGQPKVFRDQLEVRIYFRMLDR